MPALRDRFLGCLVGQAIGDAIGARFEAQSPDHLRQRFPSIESLFAYVDGEFWYTDDTQMAIGVAETLIACGSILESRLCEAFVANYTPSRGYGRGTRAVLEAMEDKRDFHIVAQRYFPGGSLGNSAAMRVAPVGLMIHHDRARLWEQARLSALPTHVHPLGIEGAQLLAMAVGQCATLDQFAATEFFPMLAAACTSQEFRERMARVRQVKSAEDLPALGNGIEALESVPTAIATFAHFPHSFAQAIGRAILLGGDTDTLAAMTGALSGAYLGIEAIPQPLLQSLETSPKGRDYLLSLAHRLFAAHLAAVANA